MKFIIFISILSFKALPASAFLLVEPSIGYHRGQEQSSAVQGIGLGLRVGWSSNFFIALDADYSDVQQAAINSAKYIHQGATAGLNLERFRFWYGMISKASWSAPSGTFTNTYLGSGYKIGIGSALSNSLSLNLEMKNINYTSAILNDVTTPVSEIATLGFLSLSWIM